MAGNVVVNNTAADGSAVMLVVMHEQAVSFTRNTLIGGSEGPLLFCDAIAYVVPGSNRLVNTQGPDLSGACIAGPK